MPLPLIPACDEPVAMTEFEDTHELITDLQGLLADGSLAFHTAICRDGTSVPLHTQLLRARSPYFDTLLRAPWSRPTRPIKLPLSSGVVHDVLEFMVTGRVQLDSLSSTLSIGRAAHFLICDGLVSLCAQHLRGLLTLECLPNALALASEPSEPAEQPLPEPFCDALRKFVSHAPGPALRVVVEDKGDEAVHVRRSVLLLLADAFTRGEIGAAAASEAALALSDWSSAGALKPVLARCSPNEADAVAMLLCAAPPRLFARFVEPSGAVPPARCLEKYRRDAMKAKDRQEIWARYVKRESKHPHPLAPPLPKAALKVRVRNCDAVLVRFDPRSSLATGAELVFYAVDPTEEFVPPENVLARVSEPVPTSISLMCDKFWFALVCENPKLRAEEEHWGWLFYVYPTMLKIDQTD